MTLPAPSPQFTVPGHTLVQARFARTGADPVVNTFAFARSLESTDLDIRDRLDTFYAGLTGAQVVTLQSFMTNKLRQLTYVMRDTGAPAGSPGREVPSALFLFGNQGAQLPYDVAIAISYRGAPPFTARRRGRIFLPGISTTALNTGTGQITDAARAACNAAAKGLASASLAKPVRWVIASRAGNQSVEIRSGYTDEHFDTQRRRDPGTEFFGRRPDDWAL